MAVDLLQDETVQHAPAHDLESFVYVLCWIMLLFDGPQSKLRDEGPHTKVIEGWYDSNDYRKLANTKQGCISSGSHLRDISPYYNSLGPLASELGYLVEDQLKHTRASREPPRFGRKRRHSEATSSNSLGPLQHDAVIAILHRACSELANSEPPEDLIQPFFLQKAECYKPEFSTTKTTDLGGGRQTKRRRVMRRIRGPVKTARL